MKRYLVRIEIYAIIIILLWVGVTTIIQMFKCPELTQTEIFLNIPKSFMLNWKNCQ